jgi:hypothetical protein
MSMSARSTIVGGVVALMVAFAAANCGGGGETDAQQLKALREDVEYTFDKSDDEVVQIVDAALALSVRNVGTPLGEEAFAFAEDLFLRHSWNDYYGDRYIESVAAPADVQRIEDFQEMRRLVGFAESVPATYQPSLVLARLHTRFVSRVDYYLFRLEQALEARQIWAQELQGAGSTSHAFNTEVSGGWEEYSAELAYVRTLAARAGEPADFLAGSDLVAAAITIAAYEPPAASRSYEDGTFIATYTLDAVQAGAANVEALAAAIAAARQVFPPTD